MTEVIPGSQTNSPAEARLTPPMQPSGSSHSNGAVTARNLCDHGIRADHYLAEVLDASPDAIVGVELEGSITSWNHSAERMLGYTAGEIAGKSLSVLSPDAENALERVRRGERVWLEELKWARKDGSQASVSVTISPIGNLTGMVAGAVIIARDISDRILRREAEQRLSTLLELSNNGIVNVDLQGNIQSWSRNAERIFGYTADEVIGRPATILDADQSSEAERVELLRQLHLLQGGEAVAPIHTTQKCKDGRRIEISLAVSPIRSVTGELIGISQVIFDVSRQRQMEAAARHMAAIVTSSDDAIVGKTLNGTITSWNHAAEKMFGYTAEEAVGKSITMLALPDRPSEMPALLDRIRRGERVEHYETLRRTKDGRYLPVSLAISPIRDAAGQIIGASKIARDITEQKCSEDALKATNMALLRANRDLEQFAFAAVHDLQEPLRMVSLYTQILKRKYGGQLDKQADDFIKFSVDGANRMQELVDDLLVYTRAAVADEAEISPISLQTALDETINILRPIIEETGATIQSSGLPVLKMEAVHARQLLQNLISNALKYRSEIPPKIIVSAKHAPEGWIISVADNGIGIRHEYKEYIFGIFKRLHTSASYPGTGIGLALCQRIAERYRGRIWVESNPGEGATFHVSIPDSD